MREQISLYNSSYIIHWCRRFAIVRDMTAAGAGLNKFCYAGLIAAHINKTPIPDDTPNKVNVKGLLCFVLASIVWCLLSSLWQIIEYVKQSKGWSSVDSSSYNTNNMMAAISDEELYNLPTAEYVNRRGFLNRQLTVYHVALHACAELKNVEVISHV